MYEVGVDLHETVKGTFYINVISSPPASHSVQHVRFEAIRFAMAATNQNEVGYNVQRASTLLVTGGTGSEWRFSSVPFIQFREMRSDEMSDMNAP